MSHPPSAEGIVLVDFDGTLFPWGQLFTLGEPMPGAIDAVQRLKQAGFTVGIFTSRLSATWHLAEGRDPKSESVRHTRIVAAACVQYGIPFDFITAEKVPAVLYLDDKAMRVNEARPINDAVTAFFASGDAAL